MIKRWLPGAIVAGLFAGCMYGQGLNTKASPTDWEEINFDFDSSVLTDGYPSLLRMANLLKLHPEYKVSLTGNTDAIGSNGYNDRLAVRRANTVAQFLQKYGAATNQVEVKGDGKRNPEVSNGSKPGRWINRRVVMTVTGPNGAVITEAGISEAGPALESDIMKRLSKLDMLDDILKQLQGLEAQVAALKGDTGQILTTANSIKTDTTTLVARPAPLSYEQTQQIARAAADYALQESELRNHKYSVLGLNVGPTFLPGRTGNFSASAYGKLVIPFGNSKTYDQPGTHAVQLGGEWLYWPYRSEGEFEGGVVERYGHVQGGVFGQFLHTNFRNYQGGANLGQASFTLEYLFQGGKIGVFGAKGFLDDEVVSKASLPTHNMLVPAYVRIEDQIGVQAQAGLFGDSYIEGNFAYKKSLQLGLKTRPAAGLRLVVPFSDAFAITAEGSVNTTFQNMNDGGRVVFGFEFGQWLRPKHYMDLQVPVPAYVPRVHYEILER